MEKAMVILVYVVGIATLVLITIIIIAVLKVAADNDKDYELSERIKFQAKEGLIRRGNEADDADDDNKRSDENIKGMGEDNRDSV